MRHWPDEEETLLNEFLDELRYKPANQGAYRSALRHFQRFVSKRKDPTAERTLRAWVKDSAASYGTELVVDRAVLVKRFLDWLVERGAVSSNPFSGLRERYECHSTSAIVRALLDAKPDDALEALRPPPRYASHLGPFIRDHVQRMRSLGFRYAHEDWFIRFDRYLQNRPEAKRESFDQLVREYVATANTPAGKLHHLRVARVVASALQRQGIAVTMPGVDRLLLQEVARKRVRPYIYSVAEIEKLLETARSYKVSREPMMGPTLHCMVTIAYCAGLRLTEIAGLKMKDVNLDAKTIEVRDTKFFKSRCLPLSSSATAVVHEYLTIRSKAGASADPEAQLFCHSRGGYSRVRTGQLLRRMISLAGLKPHTGRGGPRIHDLRHTFVVHRMTQWYQQGINPQGRLPHLATYLGHRSIHSTLIYLTITQELLQQANERFRAAEDNVLKVIRGRHRCQ
jgi:site-specific recombinase XerD